MSRPSDYLSHTETMFLVATTAAKIDLESKVYNYIPEDEKNALKSIFDAFKAYKTILFERIGNRGRKRLASRVKNYEPILQVRSEIQDKVWLPVDAWYDLVCYILEMKCCDCRGKKRCKLRDILWGMQVPEASIPDGVHTICEYQYKDCEITYKSKIGEDE